METVSSTPAAAPTSAPVSAPAATTTPTTSSTPTTTTTPATTSAPVAATPNAGESDASFLERLLNTEGDASADATGDASVDDGDAGADEIAAALVAAVEGEGDTTPEAPKADEPSADAEIKTAEDTPATEDIDPYESPLAPITPKALQEKIAASPELQAALEADPQLKQTLFEASRLSAETAAFREVFTSAEEAKVAAAGNAEFSAISDLVTSIAAPEDAQKFYGKLFELSIMHDDEGNVLKDANGQPMSDGTVGRLVHHTGALFLSHFEKLAETSNNPELAAAVDILKQTAFGKSEADTSDMTEAQRTRQEQLNAQEKSLREQQTAAKEASRKEYEDKIATDIDAHGEAEVTKLLGRTDLKEADRKDLAVKIRDKAYELVVANPQFQREQDALMRRQQGANTQKERIALGRKWLGIALPLVAPKAIAEAGSRIVSRQQQQQQSAAARKDATRSEGAGTLRTTKVAPANAKDRQAQTVAALTAKLGREPRTEEILNAFLTS